MSHPLVLFTLKPPFGNRFPHIPFRSSTTQRRVLTLAQYAEKYDRLRNAFPCHFAVQGTACHKWILDNDGTFETAHGTSPVVSAVRFNDKQARVEFAIRFAEDIIEFTEDGIRWPR